MDINNATVLVTGANRGIGREFTRQLLQRGARTVYATARRPETIDTDGVVRLALDITDPAAVAGVGEAAPDVDVLINNAGISTYNDLVFGDLAEIHREMDTHFFGTLSMIRAFAPVLARNGGGTIVNVMSALSLQAYSGAGAYTAGKFAERALTESARLELAGQGTSVLGLYLAATDTDMMADVDVPKNDPAGVVRQALDGVEAGAWEVLADDMTREIRAGLGRPVEELYGSELVSRD